MSNERESLDFSGDSDERVSATYRELGDERAPEHLNQRILQRAASTGQRRYLPAAPWMRPVAWAAVIGLSLAIVLEIARLPTPETTAIEVPAPLNRSATTEARQAEPESDKFADELAPMGRDSEPTPGARADVVDESAAPAAALPATVSGDRQQDSAPKPIERMAEPATPPDRNAAIGEREAAEFRPQDLDALRQAEDFARIRSGDNEETDSISSRAARSSAAMLDAAAPGCDQEARASRSTWLDCIAELEQAGLTDLARNERETLLEVYPEIDTQ